MTQKIRVAEIVESMVAGIREHIRQIATYVDRERFELTVICSAERDGRIRPELEQWRAAGVGVIEVPMVRPISPPRDILCYRRILHELRKGAFSVIHTHGSKGGFIGRMAARTLPGVAVIHTGHTFPVQWARGASGAFYLALERKACRRTHRVIALTGAQKELLVRMRVCPEEKIAVVANATELPPMPGPDDRRRAREALGIPPEEPVIGMVGRIVPQKAPDAFVGAARLVARARPDAHFVWIGDGPLRADLEHGLRRMDVPPANVHVAGEYDDPRWLYPAFDVFLFTTRWEGMPYAVLEAMAAGLPVVSMRVPGMDELVQHGRTGMLVSNDALLGMCVVELLKHRTKLSQFGAAARSLIEERFPIAQFVKRLEELYVDEASARAECGARLQENA